MLCDIPRPATAVFTTTAGASATTTAASLLALGILLTIQVFDSSVTRCEAFHLLMDFAPGAATVKYGQVTLF
jgi:hypothetical protein